MGVGGGGWDEWDEFLFNFVMTKKVKRKAFNNRQTGKDAGSHRTTVALPHSHTANQSQCHRQAHFEKRTSSKDALFAETINTFIFLKFGEKNR